MATGRRRVVWTRRALDAVDEIAEFVATDSTAAAARLVDAFVEAAGTLDTLTERGRIVPEFDDASIREIFVHDFRVIYRLKARYVEVLTVVHGARDFGCWRVDRG